MYGSLEILTATHEAYQNILECGFPLSRIQPRVFAGVDVKASAILDLSNRSIRRAIGFTLVELMNEDWQALQQNGQEAWTQAIGRGCRMAGFEGILASSARLRKGRNLIIFPDVLVPGSRLSPVAARLLPKHP